MSRIAYVNGRYVRHRTAGVHIEDRGFQFADGAYEVITLWEGRLVDEERHLDRLDRSLRELCIDPPMSRAALKTVLREMIRRNRLRRGTIYTQVTRGISRRDHAFPEGVTASLVVTAARFARTGVRRGERGVSVITLPDIRWKRCDIKSVSLLPNVLAKQRAREANAHEAWFVDGEGYVTEGASTNAWIVSRKGRLVTRSLGDAILAGVTRLSLLEIAGREGIGVEERPFTVREAKAAREALVTSTTSFVLPVVRIDGVAVGNGRPGPVARKLRRFYFAHMTGEEVRA